MWGGGGGGGGIIYDAKRRVRPFPARWQICHVLVLVFAATRRHLAL